MKKFLSGIRGKQILVSGLAVLVLVAGYFRWSVDQSENVMSVMNDTLPQNVETAEMIATEDGKTDIIEETETDYFAKARYERDCARSEATELLKVSAENSDMGENGDLLAAEKIAEYAKNIADEAAIENLVIAKGYQDCVAFVDSAGVRVVVKSDGLEMEGVSKIKDIVIGQTGVKATQIKISDKI